MTKEEFTFFIKHRLTGGKPVSSQFRKFHPGIIAIAIEQALGQVMKDVYTKDPSQLDLYAKTYSSVSVSYDATLRAFKADMPGSVVSLPNYSGIRWIVDENYPNELLIPMYREGAMNLTELNIDRHDDIPGYYFLNQDIYFFGFKETDEITTGGIADGTYYWVDGDDITYDGTTYHNGEIFIGTSETDFTGDGTVWTFEEISNVTMAIVVPYSGLADSDEVNIPSGKNEEVLAYVFQYFDMPLQDLINDSKSNPT